MLVVGVPLAECTEKCFVCSVANARCDLGKCEAKYGVNMSGGCDGEGLGSVASV